MLQEDFARSTPLPTMGGNPRIRQAFALLSDAYTKSCWGEASILRGHQPSSVPPSPVLEAYSALLLLKSSVLYTSNSRPLQKHDNQTPLQRIGLEDLTFPYRKMYLRGVGQLRATGFFYHIKFLKNLGGHSL